MKEAPPRHALRWALLGLLVIVLLCPLGVWAGVVVPREAAAERLERQRLDALADFRAQRWERPVLRGTARRQNAAEAEARALARVSEPPGEVFDGFRDSLVRGEPSPALLAAAHENEEALEALREASLGAWAWAEYDPETVDPDFLSEMQALRLLMALASERPPAACLRTLTDTLRIGQDRTAGQPLIPLMILYVVVSDAAWPILRCLLDADRATRLEAARELRTLAANPAPTGHVIEAETLFIATGFSATIRDIPAFPTSAETLRAWTQAGEMVDAWELRMRPAAEDRRVGERYPEDIAEMERWAADLARQNDTLSIAVPSYERYLRRDATTRGVIRMLWAAARLLAEAEALPGEAPAWLSEPEHVEPLTGEAFAFEATDEAVTLTTLGPNGVREGEEEETDDLVLELPASAFGAPPSLTPPTEQP